VNLVPVGARAPVAGGRSGSPPTVAPVPTVARRGARLAALDGVRALAALWVVVHHTWLTVYPDPVAHGPRGLARVLTDWMAYGHFAVVAFLVVSGYSLAIGTVRAGNRPPGGAWRFIGRRARRVLLPYWAALVVSVLLATTVLSRPTGTHWDVSLPVTPGGVLAHLLLVQDIVSSPSQINHAMWSIAIEWQLYLLLPLLLILRRRFGLTALTAGSVLVSIGLASVWWGYGLSWQGEIGLLGCFVLGLAAREVALGRAARWPWGWTATGLTLLVIGLSWWVGPAATNGSAKALFEPLVGAATACLLIHLTAASSPTRGASATRSPAVRLLSWRPLVALGTFSYSLYLTHAPVVQLVWQYLAVPLGAGLGSAVALAVLLPAAVLCSIGVAWVFFAAVERRCLTPAARAALPVEVRGPFRRQRHRQRRRRTVPALESSADDSDPVAAVQPVVPSDPRSGRNTDSDDQRSAGVGRGW
jgi:peptidoglycan/LPS O-acetylase OafA/YrhL